MFAIENVTETDLPQVVPAPNAHFRPHAMGLIPYWAKDQSFGLRTINAMSEPAAEKPAFRDAIKRRRCVIPADGFYEWKKIGPNEKQPYNFGLATGSVFAFAGLWDRWRDPKNNIVETCTIHPYDPAELP